MPPPQQHLTATVMASTGFSFAGTPSSSSSSSSFSFGSSNPSSAPSFGFGAATTLSASATSPFDASSVLGSSPPAATTPSAITSPFGDPSISVSSSSSDVTPTTRLFGSSSGTPPTSPSMFGSRSGPTTNLFGPAPSFFGSSSSGATQITYSPFAFNSSTADQSSPAPSQFPFGTSTVFGSPASGSSNLFGSVGPTPSLFGNSSAAPSSSAGTSLFRGSAATTQATIAPLFKSGLAPNTGLFGSSKSAPDAASTAMIFGSASAPTSGIFGSSTTSSQTSTPSLFGVSSVSNPAFTSSSSGFSFGTTVAPSSASKLVTFGATSSPLFSTTKKGFSSSFRYSTSSTASAAAVANASTPSSSLTGFGQISTLASASGNTSSLSLSFKSSASSASQTQSSALPSFGCKTFDFWPGSSNLAKQSSASAPPKRRASPAHAPKSSKKKRRLGFLVRPSSSPVDYSFLDCRGPRLCQQMLQYIAFPCDVAIAGKLPPETRRDEIYYHLSKAMALAATDPGPNIKSLHEKINQLQSEVEDLLAREKNREESFSKFMKTHGHDFEKERACHQAEVLKLSNQVVVAFDVGVRVGVKNFFESAKGKLFMEQACSAFVDRYKKSKAMLRDIAPMLLTYFVRAIQLSQEVINDAQASVTLDCTILKQRLKDEYPGFNGDANESADFAWWEGVIAELITPWLIEKRTILEPSSNKGKQSFDEGITADISSQPIDQSTIDAPEAEINHPSFLDSPSAA
ncbi:hypothetical protein CASFOL_005826 [Castilleja foliolosa]|uniref:Uncharacterized protein n=1 Tax=Castilleja foliolosa TaxID=1961234 RepID=A0ABD3E4L3_9LAMI